MQDQPTTESNVMDKLENPGSKIKHHSQYPFLSIQFRNEGEEGKESWKSLGEQFYKENPKGLRTPEELRWSLHRSEFYHFMTVEHAATLISRTMLEDMGCRPDHFPSLISEDEIQNSKTLPSTPIAMEDLHYRSAHNPMECSWPWWTSDRNRRGELIHPYPKLDRRFPKDKQVDVLMVHDPDNLTGFFTTNNELQATESSGATKTSSGVPEATPRRGFPEKPAASAPTGGSSPPEAKPCKRVIQYNLRDAKLTNVPWVPIPPTRSPTIAHLYLSADKKLGSGNWAHVWKGEFHLPTKIAAEMFGRCFARHPDQSPNKDAKVISDNIQQGRRTQIVNKEDLHLLFEAITTKFSVAVKIAQPNDDALAFFDNEAIMYASFPEYLSQDWTGYQVVGPLSEPQPACAVVPKSYGYFVPNVAYGRLANGLQAPTGRCMLRPLLLLEDCGVPLVNPTNLKRSSKALCFSLTLRLNRAGFTQCSVYERNVLVQPGPLHIHPDHRSMKTPSFRIIDFGRGLREDTPDDAQKQEFYRACAIEQQRARDLSEYYWHKPGNEDDSSEDEVDDLAPLFMSKNFSDRRVLIANP